MLAIEVGDRESACFGSETKMPVRHMTKDPKEEKHVVSRKQPLQNTVNHQRVECRDPSLVAKRGSGRRRGRGKGKVADSFERPVKPELEIGASFGPPVSSKCIEFHRRPGYGQVGTRCIVKANHFLAELPDKDLNQYDVTIVPEVRSRSVNRAIIAELVRVYRETELGMRLPAYDGRKGLYTAGVLPFSLKEFTIKLSEEDEGLGITREKEYRVVIKFVARADVHHMRRFIEGKQSDAPQEVLQVLDIVLKEISAKRYISIGRCFYSPGIRKPQRLGDGLQCWCGFYQSIKPTQMGLSPNIGNHPP